MRKAVDRLDPTLRTRHKRRRQPRPLRPEKPQPLWGEAGAFPRSGMAASSMRRGRVISLLARPEVPVGGSLPLGSSLCFFYLLRPRFPTGRGTLERSPPVFGVRARSVETVFRRSVAASSDGVACFFACACAWTLVPGGGFPASRRPEAAALVHPLFGSESRGGGHDRKRRFLAAGESAGSRIEAITEGS